MDSERPAPPDIAGFDRATQCALAAAIRTHVRVVGAHLGGGQLPSPLTAIIVGGSYGAGRADIRRSDLDLVLVVDACPSAQQQDWNRLAAALDAWVTPAVLPPTPAPFSAIDLMVVPCTDTATLESRLRTPAGAATDEDQPKVGFDLERGQRVTLADLTAADETVRP